MNENVLDLLLYLFENYPLSDMVDHGGLREDLDEAGFLPEEVDHAFAWLRGTSPEQQRLRGTPDNRTLRVFCEQETRWLPSECQGLLHELQTRGILSGETREIVIDRLWALASEDDSEGPIRVEQVKWVVMMVLSNQNEDGAYAHMESLLNAEQDVPLH